MSDASQGVPKDTLTDKRICIDDAWSRARPTPAGNELKPDCFESGDLLDDIFDV